MTERFANDFVPFKVGIRTAKKGGEEQLRELLETCGSVYDVFSKYRQASTDACAVNFDCENNEMDDYICTTKHGLNFIDFWGGGDWEYPVHGFIYWDGTEMRCYIPIRGNSVNYLNMSAFGNSEDEETCDIEYARKFGYIKPEDYYDEIDEFPDYTEKILDYDYSAAKKEFESAIIVDGVKIEPDNNEVFDLTTLPNKPTVADALDGNISLRWFAISEYDLYACDMEDEIETLRRKCKGNARSFLPLKQDIIDRYESMKKQIYMLVFADNEKLLCNKLVSKIKKDCAMPDSFRDDTEHIRKNLNLNKPCRIYSIKFSRYDSIERHLGKSTEISWTKENLDKSVIIKNNEKCCGCKNNKF